MRKSIHLIFGLLLSWNIALGADSTQATYEAFRIADISEAIEETTSSLKLANSKIESIGSIDDIINEFNTAITDATELRMDTSLVDWNSLSLPDLDQHRKKWVDYLDKIDLIDKKLTNFNHSQDELKEIIAKYETKWQLTSDVALEEESAEALQERITTTLEYLVTEKAKHKEVTDRSFSMIDSITREKIFVSEVIVAIKVLYDKKKELIFVKDSPNFYEMIMAEPDSTSESSWTWTGWISGQKDTKAFVKSNKVKMMIHFFIFIGLIFFFFYTRKKVAELEELGGEKMSVFVQLLNYPIVLSILFGLTLSFWFYDKMPTTLVEQLMLVIIVLVTWILHNTVNKDYKWALVLLSILYISERFHIQFAGQGDVHRWFLLLQGLGACVFAIYLSRPASVIYKRQRNSGMDIIKLFPIIPIVLGIAIYANLTGSVLFSRIILTTVLKSAVGGVILYMFVTIIEGMLEFLILGPLKERIRLLETKSDEIRHWTRLILRIWAIFIWIRLVLGLLQIRETFNDWWYETMAFGWEFGEINLTVELIVDFALIIIIFSLIANITRSLLEIEILPRFNLKKGIPMAVAVVTRYIILVLGFFMAVAAAGISLDKLGFLAGALGVGIGFGLQNVVGNFVSGLILIFERPIHIDDVIVTENIEGVVKEVGIRASKIRSWDGAEVIVPNMDLISRQVTNWTLSDTKRRREQLLKLEYGTDPNKVIEIIKSLLEKKEDVLKEPPPMVLFLGYQQYSMDFRVLFWLNGNMLQGSSDVALDIHNSLKKEGIEVAIPRQRMIWDEKKANPVKKVVKRTPGKTTSSNKKDDTPQKEEEN